MTLLHDYQDGTSYSRESLTRRQTDPAWRKRVPLYKSLTADGAETVELARPEAVPEADLWRLLRERRSRREFLPSELPQETLYQLLWAAQGITLPGRWAFRTAPSAGALYPVETYVAAARVDGVEPGVYHWELPEERLARVAARPDVSEAACTACLGQQVAALAPATFIWTALWGRGAQKYGDRALRYAYLDAGHLAQNLHLAAEALGLGCCMIGAFLDDEMNALAGVDGREESAIYAACVGQARR